MMHCVECHRTDVTFNHPDDYVCDDCVEAVEERANESADFAYWHQDD